METPEPKLNWHEVMTLYFSDDPETTQRLDTSLQESEKFTPDTLGTCEAEDIKAIQRLMNELHEEAKEIPYFHYYLRLLGKIQALIAERFPDEFMNLSPRMKRHLVDYKSYFPHERAVKRGIFDVLSGKTYAPQRSAYTFKDIVRQKFGNTEKKILGEKLQRIFDEYQKYFEENPDL